MKRLLLSLVMLCILILVQAQDIKSGSSWNVGNLDYTAQVNIDNTITFTSMAEGEELAFRLTPNYSKKNMFILSDELNVDGINTFSDSPRVSYVEKQGWKLLCLYDLNDRLLNLLDGTQTTSGEKVVMSKWMEQVMGDYVSDDGETISIGWERMTVGGVECTYENIDFNGNVTGVVNIAGGSRLDGLFEITQTLDGIMLYKVEQVDYGMFKRTGIKEHLTWVNEKPRFGYANRILLNDNAFRKLKKSTLRVMRNSILARHGYKFSSPDLVSYFGSQKWYSPRQKNDGIDQELTLIEVLNIDLIKAEEGKPDIDRYIKEE